MRSTPAFTAIALIALALPAGSADDNILRRDKGIVTYKLPTTDPRSLYAEVAVGDSVIATTAIATLATLQLSDSSEIRIGDRTTVRVGELHAAEAANPAGGTIFIERGAVRFNVVHPKGAKADYRFVTPTTQLAVRGTVGYFVAGPAGDQVYCVKCAAGDVTITTGTQTVQIHSGQTLNVHVEQGVVTGSEVVVNRTINNPAIDQFLGGFSPFGKPSLKGSDMTESGSGQGL
ncbi:MAG TPA: FecR domain-containing protein [Candidatus Acidoferrales bacterium]|nr:FecR domain-containing protein [Candidatus Acidoferrales bacterium]